MQVEQCMCLIIMYQLVLVLSFQVTMSHQLVTLQCLVNLCLQSHHPHFRGQSEACTSSRTLQRARSQPVHSRRFLSCTLALALEADPYTERRWTHGAEARKYWNVPVSGWVLAVPAVVPVSCFVLWDSMCAVKGVGAALLLLECLEDMYGRMFYGFRHIRVLDRAHSGMFTALLTCLAGCNS